MLGDIESNLFFIRNSLPKEKAENLKIIYNILQRRSTISSNAEHMSDSASRGIPDQQLLKSAKGDNNKILSFGSRGAAEEVTNIVGDSEFIDTLDYNDLKRLLFLTTQKMNRGGLMVRK